MAKKKRYTKEEVTKLMDDKYGKNSPHINHTMNYEPDMRYRVGVDYFQTLLQIVERYGLDT